MVAGHSGGTHLRADGVPDVRADDNIGADASADDNIGADASADDGDAGALAMDCLDRESASSFLPFTLHIS